ISLYFSVPSFNPLFKASALALEFKVARTPGISGGIRSKAWIEYLLPFITPPLSLKLQVLLSQYLLYRLASSGLINSLKLFLAPLDLLLFFPFFKPEATSSSGFKNFAGVGSTNTLANIFSPIDAFGSNIVNKSSEK